MRSLLPGEPQTTTVPNHPGRDLARPLVREILREIELTPDQFQEILSSAIKEGDLLWHP